MDREKNRIPHKRASGRLSAKTPTERDLKKLPRVARMYQEVLEGINYSNHEIAQMFGKTFAP